MSYARWFWAQLSAIKSNVIARIIIGIAQAAFGLLLVWLSRRFIDCARRVVREITGEKDANATDIQAPDGIK